MSRRLAIARTIATAGWLADAKGTSELVVLTLVSSVGGAVNALWLKLIIDGAIHHRSHLVLGGAIALGLTQSLLWFGGLRTGILLPRISGKSWLGFQNRLVIAMMSPQRLDYLTDPESLAKVELLRSQAGIFGQAGGSIAWFGGPIIGLFATLALLASVQPWLLLLPVIGLPSVFAGMRSENLAAAADAATADDRRLARGLFENATQPGPAKELRNFDLASWIVSRHRVIWKKVDASERAVRLRSGLWGLAGGTLFGLGYLAALSFVAWRFVHGMATAGGLVLTFILASQVGGLVSLTLVLVPQFMRCTNLVGLLLDLEQRQVSEPLAEGLSPPLRLDNGISLSQVSFGYPGDARLAIDHLDLHLPAGAVVALVGENGAGKSTIVQLLCGLYAPSAGEIRVDHIALESLSQDKWRDCVASGFQDFLRLELTAGHNVGVGHLPEIENEVAVGEALVRAGVADLVGQLPSGLATLVGHSFLDGHEPSGGQWQKLAMGRAMMRPHPLLLVLDEPTANLDPGTEHQLFLSYAENARRLREDSGTVTLFVTHRFSTVRMADLIIVLAAGKVIDQGTHDELMERAGLYAELYSMQASGYGARGDVREEEGFLDEEWR